MIHVKFKELGFPADLKKLEAFSVFVRESNIRPILVYYQFESPAELDVFIAALKSLEEHKDLVELENKVISLTEEKQMLEEEIEKLKKRRGELEVQMAREQSAGNSESNTYTVANNTTGFVRVTFSSG